MEENLQSAEAIKDIRRMMERSSRFISLSGLSGISAGICALTGVVIAYPYVYCGKDLFIDHPRAVTQLVSGSLGIFFNTWLFWIAAGTFLCALFSAFIFTRMRSKKQGISVWGFAARRLIAAVSIPIIAGGIFIIFMLSSQMLSFRAAGLITPACLIFYGLALLNAAAYSFPEIKYLGYCQVALGIINLYFNGYGLYFWAVGFELLHIVYGIYMWQKYESAKSSKDDN